VKTTLRSQSRVTTRDPNRNATQTCRDSLVRASTSGGRLTGELVRRLAGRLPILLHLGVLAVLVTCARPSPEVSTNTPSEPPTDRQSIASEAPGVTLNRQVADLQTTVVAHQARLDAQREQIAALSTVVAQPRQAASIATPSAPQTQVASRPADPARAALRAGGLFVQLLLVGDVDTAIDLVSPSAHATRAAQLRDLAAALRGCETVVQHVSTTVQGRPGFNISSTFTPACGNQTEISEQSVGTPPGNPTHQLAVCSVDVELLGSAWQVTDWSCSP
jgi:hypothetical protein